MTRFDPCEEVQEHIQLSMSKSPCAAQEILLHLRSSTRSCGSFFVYTNTHLSTVRNITRTSTLRCIHFLGTSIKFWDALNVSWCLRTPTVQTPFVGTCYLSLGWIVLRAFAHSIGSRTLHFVASFTNILLSKMLCASAIPSIKDVYISWRLPPLWTAPRRQGR